jgi:hypothetical protein
MHTRPQGIFIAKKGKNAESSKLMATVFWDMEGILLIEDIKNALK